VKDVLSDHPSTSLLVNCTGLGSLALSDIKDIDMYPTRGQTLLVAEPQEPINRMYEADRKYERTSRAFRCPYPSFPFELTFIISVKLVFEKFELKLYRYLRSPARINPTTTYIFPRPLGGGIILGGSRDDNNWSEEWDEQVSHYSTLFVSSPLISM
jgi:D-amino-acid oxidase